jgi:hypothetical protein
VCGFHKESRMRFANATKLNGKSGRSPLDRFAFAPVRTASFLKESANAECWHSAPGLLRRLGEPPCSFMSGYSSTIWATIQLF